MDPPQPDGRASALARWLAINRTVGVVLVSVLLFGLGAELWSRFLPVYLTDTSKQLARQASDSATVPVEGLFLVGLYVLLLNLFEAACYLGGGQLTARLGDRGALFVIGLASLAGYALFLVSSHPLAVIVAALLILGWDPLATPVTFTAVGSTVDPSKRGMAFAVQSIQKRLPKVLGPLIAGFVVGWAVRQRGDQDEGVALGMWVLVMVALGLAVTSLLVQWRYLPRLAPPPPGPPLGQVWREMPPALRRLLLAEVFTRIGEWMTREFIVLYVVLVQGLTFEAAGGLVALQHFVALATYLPIGRTTTRVGLRPFVGLSFVFFALTPLALVLCPPGWLWLAFVVAGLREVGEPARKAMITSLFPEEARARGVGLYWAVRSLAYAPAGLAGAALWWWLGPQGLLGTAFAVGAVGAAVYYATVPADR